MRLPPLIEWQKQFEPKLLTVLRQGYGLSDLRRDLLAGLTVAIVALPLAMALAIASGTTPEKGLHTAIIAGFLISFLGGSRLQIGGPTAAFIPVVFTVITQFGYGGMVLCTMMAGVLLIVAGLLRLGTLMKFMPQPVITGFTAGIAVSIFSSQVKDLLGLEIDELAPDFIGRWTAYGEHIDSLSVAAIAVAGACLILIVGLRRWRPAVPGFLIAVVGAALVCSVLPYSVDTIGSRFGDIPAALPSFSFPNIPFDRVLELLPSAFTIAFLAGVESLLSAVVADGMTGGRHRSNGELVAQGVANIGSALFGGLPATGAIARTAVNIRSGGRSPVSGISHALFLLIFMLLLTPWMRYVPLPALAAVLVVVAWQMSDASAFRHLLKGPLGDRIVLLLTFVLTIAFDLTVAIQAGLVLAAFLFMHRMSEAVQMQSHAGTLESEPEESDQRALLPPGVEAFQITGPLFFAVTNRLDEVLNQFPDAPRVFILRMRLVPMIDASGVTALGHFHHRCQRQGTRLILSGVHGQPLQILQQMKFFDDGISLRFANDFAHAIAMAGEAWAEAKPA